MRDVRQRLEIERDAHAIRRGAAPVAVELETQMTPRRIWSSSMDSNNALKLPSPKPWFPLRWMISKKIGPMTLAVKICSRMPSSSGAAAVDEDAPLAQLFDVLVVTGDAAVDAFVVGLGRVLERDAAAAQHVDGAVDVVGRQRDVLDALAAVLAQVFLDLRLVVLRLVDRDADLAAGAGQRAREQPGLLAFDVEVADLAEVEQRFVESPSTCPCGRDARCASGGRCAAARRAPAAAAVTGLKSTS